MIFRNVTGIFILAVATGCAPLHQAPLVYSSKTTLGVDIAATSTETPGMAFSVGFKSVDAAYVPIAVAKECPPSLGVDCLHSTFELKTIAGESINGGERAPTRSDLKAEEIVKQYKFAQDEADNARKFRESALEFLTSLTSRKANLEDLQKRVSDYQISRPALQSEQVALEAKVGTGLVTPEEVSRLLVLKEKLNLEAVPTITQSQIQELQGFQSKIDAANLSIAEATSRLSDKENKVKEFGSKVIMTESYKNNINRRDAYSVYGRFESDSNMNGTQKAASVGLGKVFSTGVASQNLADGLRHYYKNLGVAACYEAVGKLKTNTTTEAQMAKWVAECKDVVSDARDGF